MMDLNETLERMITATEKLEQAVERMNAQAQENIGRIVATVEPAREDELLRRLEEAEAKIATLTAANATARRKTLSPGTSTLLAKDGVATDAIATIDAGAVDAALSSLSIEQRIAVKAELLRAGLLG